MSSLNALNIRRSLGRDDWGVPQPFGPDGWRFDHRREHGRIIASVSDLPNDPRDFVHASISWADRNPDYSDLVTLHHAIWGATGYAYQVFAPAAEHVNIHEHALHLWGLLDGSPLLPNFAFLGTI